MHGETDMSEQVEQAHEALVAARKTGIGEDEAEQALREAWAADVDDGQDD